jgi:stearoyl-CoA desaturase (Delta-9 desaturase)
VKPWQFDPTKWLIWTLSKLRLVRNLRRVPADKIRSAQRVACAPAGRNAPT